MVAQIDSVYKTLSLKIKLKRIVSYLGFEGRPLTTKGRFINSPLKVLYSAISFFSSASPRCNVAYVLGTGRSGTTILGVSLSAHENVGFLNEPKLPWFWSNSRDDIIGSYSLKPGNYALTKVDADALIERRITKFYNFYSAVIGVDVVLDKYPEMIFRTDFLQAFQFNKKFIFLYRNGVDIVSSITKWSERKSTSSNENTEDWWGLNDLKWKLLCADIVSKDPQLSKNINTIQEYNKHEFRAAVEWIVTMRKGLELEKVLNKQIYLPLKYEEYIEHAGVRQGVLNFLGLKNSSSYEYYCNNALKSSSRHESRELSLPSEIAHVFNDLQAKLGYNEYANVSEE